MTFAANAILKAGSFLAASMLILQQNVAAMVADSPPAKPTLPVIYQVQTGSNISSSQEYVTIYNNSENPVEISNWCLYYASSSGASEAKLGCFTPPNDTTRLMLPGFGSVLAASEEFKAAHPEYPPDITFKAGLAATGGHIRLYKADKSIADVLGYGTATQPESKPVIVPASGKILKRQTYSGKYLEDTNNNSTDFAAADMLIGSSGIYEERIIIDLCSNVDGVQETLPDGLEEEDSLCLPPALDVEDIAITELLPNPAGADSGKEYIEFYNPHNQPVSLKDYQLRLGPAFTKQVTLPDIMIPANSYLAATDALTGLTLPNGSASVQLVTPKGNAISQTADYNQLADDVSWSLFDDRWQATYTQTPGAANIATTAKPCAAGYERTNTLSLCQKVPTSILKTIAACAADQERNQATGRCRKLAMAIVQAVCKQGYVRNLETGRCKKVAAVEAAKACPAGQERNASTGRCRKAATKAGDLAKVQDVQSPLLQNNIKWWAAGVAGSGSASYAVYEWREELRRRLGFLSGLLQRFKM